ncbi:hypothetical protein OsI_23037 [Oryza sativa Indica Group]|uniref:Uncharacterized protein n=2 Tax=Oryza sativa TaxID=4530 RepID=A2YD42_ORYSI|nr:hypothetical protein OsI_23037 [Oryza sativa Indica Group]
MWDLRAYDEQLLISVRASSKCGGGTCSDYVLTRTAQARSPASGGGCFRGLKCSRRLLLDTIFFPCFSEAIVFNVLMCSDM